MKKMLTITLLIVLPLLTAFTWFQLFGNKERLLKVSDYKIFYGTPTGKILDEMRKFDLVIIETHEYTSEQIKAIQQDGTIVLGYLSVMELETWNESLVKKVEVSDYLFVDKKKRYISKWDTYLMDLSSKHYQELLLTDARKHILNKGVDGIFIDTAGDIDDYFYKDEQMKQMLRDGYRQLLISLKQQNPEILVVQNWGFDTYKTTTKNLVNGIMWENFDVSKLENSEWGRNWIEFFKKEQKLAVFTVTPDEKSRQYSKKQGFIPYQNNSSIYNEWE